MGKLRKSSVKKKASLVNPFRFIVGIVLLSLIILGVEYVVMKKPDFSQFDLVSKLLKPNGWNVQVELGEGYAKNIINSKAQDVVFDTTYGKVTLSVPEKAMSEDTKIALTEIKSLAGMPEGTSFVSGVHVQAEDFAPGKPLTLSIPLPSGIEADKLRGFSYDGEGMSIHEYPVIIRDGNAEFSIVHASGYGVFSVSDPKMKLPTPSEARMKAEANLANLQQSVSVDMRSGNRTEVSENDRARMTEYMQNWYHDGVKRKLAKAIGNSHLLADAMYEFLYWRQFTQLLGIEDRLESEIADGRTLLGKAISNAVKRAADDCVNKKDPTMIARLSNLAAAIKALGDEAKGTGGLDEKAMEDARKCARFRLKISSEFINYSNMYDGTPVSSERAYHGEVLISLDENLMLTGEGQIESDYQKLNKDTCSLSQKIITPLKVESTYLKVISGKPRVSIILWEGDSPKATCFMSGSHWSFTGEASTWDYDYWNLHESDAVGYEGMKLDNWEIVNSGGVYARKINNVRKPAKSGGTDTEKSTFELIHEPRR